MTYTYIPGYAGHTSGHQTTVNRIVIHATVSPCRAGVARDTAAYFQSAHSGGLAHYVVDPVEVIQTCREDVVCWHAPPNHGSIGVELCDPQTGDAARWGDADHQRMLALAAPLVAGIARRWQVPVLWLSPADLASGRRGITSHVNVSRAFRESDHTDPGDAFPTDRFLSMVRGEAPAPAQQQAQQPQTGDDVAKQYALADAHGQPANSSRYILTGGVLRRVTNEAALAFLVKEGQVEAQVTCVSAARLDAMKKLTVPA